MGGLEFWNKMLDILLNTLNQHKVGINLIIIKEGSSGPFNNLIMCLNVEMSI